MKFKADQKGTSRFFSAKLGWSEHYNPRELEMLSNNIVPMLIPPSTVLGRKNNVIQFNISEYSTLEFYITCILSKEQFAELLLQCVDVLRRMQAVYLSYKNLVIDLDKIYVRIGDRTIHFIYLPLMGNWHEVSLPDFFKTILRAAGQSTYEQVQFVEACIAWLDRPVPFLLEEFDAFICGYTDLQTQVSVVQPAPISEPKPWILPSQLVSQGIIDIKNNTSPLEGPSGQNLPHPTTRYYLLRDKTNEKIEITESPFLVGTELGTVSYCITGNPAVSRKHAKFLFESGQCVIIDQNSTNKTYVNNLALTPQVIQLLQNGDQIRFGNECFTFVVECDAPVDSTVLLSESNG